MISLQDALERLLTDAAYREAFLAGEPLCEAHRDALSAIDGRQLCLVAEGLRESVMHRRYRGSGGIATWYPRTLAGANPEEVSSAFLASARYREWRELPFAGRGRCLEDAFFRFCEDQDLGEPEIRESEFLAAMARALVTSPRPAFDVPPEIGRVPGGYAGITRRSGPTLHAAVNGRVVTGTVTPFLADLVFGGEPGDVATRHGVSLAVLDASLQRLRQVGLV